MNEIFSPRKQVFVIYHILKEKKNTHHFIEEIKGLRFISVKKDKDVFENKNNNLVKLNRVRDIYGGDSNPI